MSDFQSNLEKNITERVTALFEIERVLFTKRYNLSKKHYDLFSVQSISMIYSIWEGFIQTSFNMYIYEINNQNINLFDVKDELLIYHVENSFKQFNEYPDKQNKKIYFFNKLNGFFENKKLQLEQTINTQNNVSFETLNIILKTFGIEPFDKYWEKYKYPNPSLENMLASFLKYRNGVAHGGDISSEEKVTQSVFNKYKVLVTELMYEIQNRMLESITNKLYLRK